MAHPLITFIEQRVSINVFDPARVVSDDQIEQLIRLATRAPTSFNLQNWRFIAVRTRGAKARLQKVAWGQQKVLDAAVTFIVCGQLASHDVLTNRLAPSINAGFMTNDILQGWIGAAKGLYFEQPQMQRDEAIRTATFGASMLILAAEALGLASGPMIGFEPDGVAREFGLAANEVPAVLLAVGYAAQGNWPQKPRRALCEVLTLA